MTQSQWGHGAHEVLDVHEALSTMIGALNKMAMIRPLVQCTELQGIIDRQHAFLTQEYNTTLECFQTGKDPAVPTKSYMMQENSSFTFGLQPGSPSKPVTSSSEINDQVLSGFLLGAAKSVATARTAAALEATNPVVRRVLADSIPNAIEMAYETSIYQNKKGWYQVPQLQANDTKMMTESYAPAAQATFA